MERSCRLANDGSTNHQVTSLESSLIEIAIRCANTVSVIHDEIGRASDRPRKADAPSRDGPHLSVRPNSVLDAAVT
jgi:hypothetical protein